MVFLRQNARMARHSVMSGTVILKQQLGLASPHKCLSIISQSTKRVYRGDTLTRSGLLGDLSRDQGVACCPNLVPARPFSNSVTSTPFLFQRLTLPLSCINNYGNIPLYSYRQASTSSFSIIRRVQLARLRYPFEYAARTNEPSQLLVTIEQHKALYEALLESGDIVDADEVVAKYESTSGLFSNDLKPVTQSAQTDTSPSETTVSTQKKSADKPNDKDAQQVVKNQWELISNNLLFDLYLRALAISGEPDAGDKVLSATQRRQYLLGISSSDPQEPPHAMDSQPGTDAPVSSQTSVSPHLTNEQIATTAMSWGRPDKVIRPVEPTPPSSTPQQPTVRYSGSAAASNASSSSSPSPSSSPFYSGKVGSKDNNATAAVRVIVEEARGNILYRILRFLGVTIVYGLIMLAVLSLFIDSSGLMRAAASPGGGTNFQPTDNSGKQVTFNDVHGCEEAKDELQEVVEFLRDPGQFGKLGGKLPKGVLLTGPPGTGKTLLARAVAGEADVRFFSASGSEFDEMFVGVGAKRVRELFGAARKHSPAIVFIDELDAIGSKRSPRDYQHMKQTLNQLLVELDGFTQTEGIILIGATNVPEALDKALTRPGRFDRHINVTLPDVRGRVAILNHHAGNIRYDKDIDFSLLARGTPGFSGAELQNLVNQAAVKASKEHSAVVTLNHLEWAKDKILMGAERRSAYITEESKRLTAYHEGGHALVAFYTAGAMPLHRVTCIPRGVALGLTQQLPEMDRNSFSFAEFKARLDVAMGGRAAEELIFGKENITSGASSDIRAATTTASNMVRQLGYSDAIGPIYHAEEDSERTSPQTLAKIESEVRRMVEEAAERASTLLEEKRHELELLKDALIEHETLDPEEIKKVLRGEKLDRKAV